MSGHMGRVLGCSVTGTHRCSQRRTVRGIRGAGRLLLHLLASLMDDRRVMRDSRQERLMRRRGMNEASGPERVDEPVNRIPVHGIAVNGARRYHSGQRYPPRLYLVRGGGGGGGGVRMAARNRAATSSVYGTSPVLRHNWNSMTATTRGRERRTMTTPGGWLDRGGGV